MNQSQIRRHNIVVNGWQLPDNAGGLARRTLWTIKWRKFYDINFVNIDYEPFDAPAWQTRDAVLQE
jgi:hypothetical protein